MSDRHRGAATEDTDELFVLLDCCARVLVKSSEPTTFLDWFADAGPALAPTMASQVDPRTGPPGLLFRSMGVAIYNAMPQPTAAFQPRKLPVPGRNDPCLCGSRAKYKQCCLPMAGILDLSDYNLLRHVLDNLPQKRFIELPRSRVDLLALSDTARQWREEELTARAVTLLAPWFSGNTALTGKHEPLFDQLMECYLELGNTRKRERLVAQIIERGDKALRAVALQRRSMMLADQGDTAGAWKVFAEAQRMDPDNPSHALLELTLLISRGESVQARERARFWLARLERLRDPALAEVITFVRAVREEPSSALASVDRERLPGLALIEKLFATAPTAAAHYAAPDQGEGERRLEPDAALCKLEKRWREIFPQGKPSLTATRVLDDEMWNEPDAWLEFLARNPLAWQSFEVLDDVVLAVDALPTVGAGPAMLEALLVRGVALLKAILGDTPDGTLSWGWWENRPALRLLAHRAYRALNDPARGVASDDFIAHAELLLALNPNDNHGIREQLSAAYLTRGWPEKAVELTDRYPGDLCGPALNRILALFVVGRMEDARDELLVAIEEHDVALKMLLADKPRPPKDDGSFGITVGGKQEAWRYRISAKSLWERDGGLAWLNKTWRKSRRRINPVECAFDGEIDGAQG